MTGLSPDVGGNTSLSSRLLCAKCGMSPRILNPEKITASDSMFTISVACHGKKETRMIPRSELVFIQTFFEGDADENDEES